MTFPKSVCPAGLEITPIYKDDFIADVEITFRIHESDGSKYTLNVSFELGRYGIVEVTCCKHCKSLYKAGEYK